MKVVRENLLEWYKINKRDLPWRHTREPYFIWISEIIFQQTRIDQGLDYYLRFIKKFPDVNELAKASENEVLKLWQGLGYYSRARNLHYSAKYIVNELKGEFPKTYDDIIKLKGVGPYTAAAICSICFQLPTPVIDGNVQRLISRLFAIHEAVNTSGGVKEIKKSINIIFSEDNPGDFNQAMMEFGATVCKPQNPDCLNCIFNNDCNAYLRGIVSELPIKIKAKPPKDIFMLYNIYLRNISGVNKYFLYKRTQKDVWKGLYEFPSRELKNESEAKYILNENNGQYGLLKEYKPIKHLLSHRTIIAYSQLLDGMKINESDYTKNGNWYSKEELSELPVSKLVEKILSQLFES